MPRYFFNLLHPDRSPVLDEEGMDFEGDAVAKREGQAGGARTFQIREFEGI